LPALAYAILTAHDVLNYNSILILFSCPNRSSLQIVANGNGFGIGQEKAIINERGYLTKYALLTFEKVLNISIT